MTNIQKQKFLQTLTTFLMRAQSEGKTETEIKHYGEGMLQTIKTLFGYAAEDEMRVAIGDDLFAP